MRRHRDPEVNFWPAVADLFLGFCIVALLLWFLQNLGTAVRAAAKQPPKKVTLVEPESGPDELASLKKYVEALKAHIETIEKERGDLEHRLAAYKKERDDLKAYIAAIENERGDLKSRIEEIQRLLNEKPPVINIASNEVRFPSGSAELSTADQETLERKKFPLIIEELRKFGARVDTIEIVGHTDGQPLSSPNSNVDRLLVDVLNGREPASRLRPGSNTDLGLMRALAVRAVLRPWLDANGHPQIQIRCYSAGSGVRPDGSPAKLDDTVNNSNHRRIEILFLGLGIGKE